MTSFTKGLPTKIGYQRVMNVPRSFFHLFMTKLIAVSLLMQICQSLTNPTLRRGIRDSFTKPVIYHTSTSLLLARPQRNDNDPHTTTQQRRQQDIKKSDIINRRDSLGILLGLSLAVLPAQQARGASSSASLEDLKLGSGRWIDASVTESPNDSNTDIIDTATKQKITVPTPFVAYASAILISYDEGVRSWWEERVFASSLLPETQSLERLTNDFRGLAASVRMGFEIFLSSSSSSGGDDKPKNYSDLAQVLTSRYNGAERHLGILFSLLPAEEQPMKELNELSKAVVKVKTTAAEPILSTGIDDDFCSLLPLPYTFSLSPLGYYSITPPLSPPSSLLLRDLVSTPLRRDRPTYTPNIYALLGLSGGIGCALTHTVVIPLDVVKTRMQTDTTALDETGGSSTNLIQYAIKMSQTEGLNSLLLGAQATIAGYLWYGISVYPSYAFCKRFIGNTLLDPATAALHANDVALLAGAMAAVVASLGLTPLEACRIRTVAEPEQYRPLGLVGTMTVIAGENPQRPLRALYAGLPSLLTRQVIFGSVKFLAFERAAEAIFRFLPSDVAQLTSMSLLVSLVAGGISGTVSSVVSHPADSVLTYVAKDDKGKNLGVWEGCVEMVENEGVGSLFRGLGSRCVWAGSIIAGQFFLYDIFRTMFGVNGDDLTQLFQIVIK